MFAEPDHHTAQGESAAPAFCRAPRTVDETGLPFLFLVELVSKVLYLRGQVSLPELANHLKLSVGVIDPLIAFMRTEKLCEVTRRGTSGTDADLRYNLTEGGHTRAAEYLARNAYAGPAPVTLAAYCAQVAAQSVSALRVTRTDVANNFRDIVANPDVLDKLGAAMNSGRAIFIHGLAGSGKTYLAERLSGLLKGAIAVPHAIMVEGEVLPLYDQALHLPAAAGAAPATGVPLDARWLRDIQRPAVLTGGELTLDMLDLRFDPGTRLYQPPPHLKANNGIFIIDDLGRQRCSAAELMNRWIVPMDRAVDYLALHTGHKFLVPFDVVVVFSSNFLPERLSDGAFLRRLGYKIEVPALSEADYERVFRQACAQYGIAYEEQAFRFLLRERHDKQAIPLLACYPRDLLRQVRDLALYEEKQASLDEQVLDWAWNNYFTVSGQRRPADTAMEKNRREPAALLQLGDVK